MDGGEVPVVASFEVSAWVFLSLLEETLDGVIEALEEACESEQIPLEIPLEPLAGTGQEKGVEEDDADEVGGVAMAARAELVDGGEGDEGPETQLELELLPPLPPSTLEDETGSLGVGVSLDSRLEGVPVAAKSTSITRPSSSSSSSPSSSLASCSEVLADDLMVAFCESSPSSMSTPLLPHTTFELFPGASAEVDEHESLPMSTPEVPMFELIPSDESMAEETVAAVAVLEA